MKKIVTLIFASLLLILNNAQAQVNKCCSGSTVAPEITLGVHASPIAGGTNTPAPVLAVTASQADLPNTEYIVTKRGTKALTELGTPDTADVIIGADADGIFTPNSMTRYGITLVNGDTFDLTAVGYDLALVKNLADKLLNASTTGGPCCSLFVYIALALNEPALAGFCDSVHNAGIFGASDIDGMNEVLDIFDVFSAGQTTIPSVIYTLETINSSGTYIDANCGGTGTNNFLPFGVNRHKVYGYERNGSVGVQQLSDVSLFLMYPNPTTNGDVFVYFTATKQIDLNINVYDAIGQKVHSQTLGNVSGDFNAQIPTGNLTAGMYFVELTDGHSSQTHKLQVR